MSESMTSMQRFETVQDASADFLLRWYAESLINETLCSDKLWGDLCSPEIETDRPRLFSQYEGRLDD